MTVPTSTLVGRESVMARLSDAVASVAEGYGGCVVLEGPAGIGKTRVLTETLPSAAAAGVTVALGRATELDRVSPLAALLTAMRSSKPPVLDGQTADELRRHEAGRVWLVDRLGELIEVYSRQRPLVVALDDLQWADEFTALALRSIVPAIRCSPVLWLLTRRSHPAHSPAQLAIDALVADGADQFTLSPLGDQAVVDLCRQLLHAEPSPALLQLAARGGGNPFLLEELFTTMRRAGRIVIDEGVATVAVDELPDTFVTAVGHRLGDLSPEARRLVEAGAVLGRPFTLYAAAALAGWSAVQLISAAREATAAGILVPRGSEFSFRHDLLREAAYDSLPEPVRTVMHREAITILQMEGRSVVEIAEHILRGGRRADTKWSAMVRQAAAELAPEAPSTAADLLLRIRELGGDRNPVHARLAADAVRLLASAGRIAEAREVGETALQGRVGPEAEAEILLGLAQAVKHAGQDALVVEYAHRGLDLPEVPERTRAQLLAVQAHGLLQTASLDAADRAGAAAAAAGSATAEYAASIFGDVARSAVARARGDFDGAVRLARDAVALADSVGGEALHHHPRLWLGRALTARDDFSAADAEFETCRHEVDRLGTAWAQPVRYRFLAELRCAQGRLNEAQAELEAGLQVADQLSATALSPALLALLSQLALRRDDLPAAQRSLERAEQLAAAGHGVAVEDLAWVAAQLHLARGDQEPAFHALTPLYEAMPENVAVFALEPRAAGIMVQLALAVGAVPLAKRVVRTVRNAADRNPSAKSLAAAAAHASGLCGVALGGLREAVKIYRDCERPLDLAAALEDAAAAEQRAGQRHRATGLRGEARELYLAAGATRDAARLQGRGHAAAARRVRIGWESLTPAELRVVHLVAEGLTNREVAGKLFLSRHTVDSHLRHAFAKLGISRRVELTREVVAREVPGRPRG